MAGRATVAHCDVLIAVWDGLAARGRGGTAEVVAAGDYPRHAGHPFAGRRQRLPACCGARSTRRVTEHPDGAAERPFDAAHVEQMLSALLLPPPDPQERDFLQQLCRRRPAANPRADRISIAAGIAGVARFAPALRESHCSGDRRKNGADIAPAGSRSMRFRRRSTCLRPPIAGATGWPATSRRPIAAATCSTSCSAASLCAWASAPSWCPRLSRIRHR